MFKNQDGFSLIELMVVVAIIGILSAVAVPQFQKFQRKAKQSEAKAHLAAIYTGQKTFLAETGSYYTNLYVIGYEPSGVLKYNAGFATSTGANVAGYTTTGRLHTNYNQTWTMCTYTFAGGVGTECMYENGSVRAPSNAAWTANASSFLVGAIARKEGLGGSVDDEWTMSQRKELINTANGAL